MIYANPNQANGRDLWGELDKINISSLWVVIGDFNSILFGHERSPEGVVSSMFVDWVESKGLIDLGYIGSKYTWNHGVAMETMRSARLDREFYDEKWRSRYSDASIHHLHHSYLDHCPLLLRLESSAAMNYGKRPFFF